MHLQIPFFKDKVRYFISCFKGKGKVLSSSAFSLAVLILVFAYFFFPFACLNIVYLIVLLATTRPYTTTKSNIPRYLWIPCQNSASWRYYAVQTLSTALATPVGTISPNDNLADLTVQAKAESEELEINGKLQDWGLNVSGNPTCKVNPISLCPLRMYLPLASQAVATKQLRADPDGVLVHHMCNHNILASYDHDNFPIYTPACRDGMK